MYLRYFGLTEKPFSIAPNPEFLFLSDRHKEALAHLTYGLGDAGGFVLLTGEVGTGKTTVTRSMLAQLPESTQVAFVLNPALSEMELLASICDELDIEYDAKDATLKSLTDVIKKRLLDNHEQGGHTMLIIDEAQHLAAEVLEQLRLLTNLETDHKKLLQIVLVGQPELQQLLQRNELRQLAQRITARYHLLPLTESQVFSYIKHRLNKAGCQNHLFSNESIAYIHQVTAGIPRLINLLADRCLLGAYSAQQQEVTKHIAQQAAKEALPLNLIPEQQTKKLNVPMLVSGWVAAMFACGFGLSYIF
ncbi:ExeA family protein [Pseudoalteromonas luteoviolacea]|uniref:ATPase AAA n=1 Tax=Pseudoalteromonas luteoviolacea S4054 TaxID=1129367 RepID=A0A0F6AEP6_9GAMM|nr:AAA family ATPase [Pseudoalteromonas luteoviolacea]AOT06803.1 AAA family ATPase [Pseudoalteromonas luteoviolacea]AOT11721.1 AAA family ATPase [Pseudoalteromonas luteoviolacea]AOT16633.1 AAA family ATPase [Pseudoalteromonas luteoviolacea]KKE83829.1 ATPase AAA [Pseudoalteromonas luteoviolacea S4054]KZN74091.1 ATPase AAA [Pseudoalteromonas luteoviolacea S4047-1]